MSGRIEASDQMLIAGEAGNARFGSEFGLAAFRAFLMASAAVTYVGLWRNFAERVSGRALPGTHWLPEQLPGDVIAELMPFLGA